MQQLVSSLRQHYSLSLEDAVLVSKYFEEEKIAKNTFYARQGGDCSKLSFIGSGMMRIFRKVGDKEVTQWISTPGYFVTDLASLSFGVPSRWSIQALTDCSVYTIHKKSYDALQRVLPTWPAIEKQFISKCFVILEERIFTQLSQTAEQRYEQLMDFDSTLFNQVPLQYLASMMGMSPETLSRIRAKKSS